MTNINSPVALGMRSPGAVFLAVWRLEGPEHVEIPTTGGRFQLLYPTDLGIEVHSLSEKSIITFPRKYMACILAGVTY